jgi:serine/threonine protein kinase
MHAQAAAASAPCRCPAITHARLTHPAPPHRLNRHRSANLVHGDVKLDNVLLKTDPAHVMGFVPKLSDFGLARVLANPDDNLRQHIFNQTGAG